MQFCRSLHNSRSPQLSRHNLGRRRRPARNCRGVTLSRHPQHCPSSSPSLSQQTRSSFSVLIIALLLQTLPLLPNSFEKFKATKSYFQKCKFSIIISSLSPFMLRQLMLISFLWLTISNPGHIGDGPKYSCRVAIWFMKHLQTLQIINCYIILIELFSSNLFLLFLITSLDFIFEKS